MRNAAGRAPTCTAPNVLSRARGQGPAGQGSPPSPDHQAPCASPQTHTQGPRQTACTHRVLHMAFLSGWERRAVKALSRKGPSKEYLCRLNLETITQDCATPSRKTQQRTCNPPIKTAIIPGCVWDDFVRVKQN